MAFKGGNRLTAMEENRITSLLDSLNGEHSNEMTVCEHYNLIKSLERVQRPYVAMDADDAGSAYMATCNATKDYWNNIYSRNAKPVAMDSLPVSASDAVSRNAKAGRQFSAFARVKGRRRS